MHARARQPGGRLSPEPVSVRLVWVGVALVAMALMVTAWKLTPAEEGIGTHTQMGMDPCSWPERFGKPCPMCGMTTSFSRAASTDFLGSFHAQPFGALLVIGTSVVFWVGLYTAATGSHLGRLCAQSLRSRVIWATAALWLGGWVYKIATFAGA